MKRAFLTILVAMIWFVVGMIAVGGILEMTVDKKADRMPMPAVMLIVAYLLTFAAIFLMGTARWAAAKGYSGTVGVILGWIGPLGLVALALLPDRSASSDRP